MLTRTHTTEVSADGTFFTMVDTTPLTDYSDNGFDFPGDIAEMDIYLYDYDGEELYHKYIQGSDLTDIIDNLRDPYGLIITAEDAIGESTFSDGIYKTVYSMDLGTDPVISEIYSAFDSEIRNKIANLFTVEEWKKLLNNSVFRISDSIILKNWYNGLKYAIDIQLISEAYRLIQALKKSFRL